MGAARVAWQPWSPATFARAKAERRPIYVNVAAGWCHWCHVMDETTLSDPKVLAALERGFVPIRIDQDARPDVAERYQDWGWPANILLTPDAQPWDALRGYQEPDEFLRALESTAKDIAKGKTRPAPKDAGLPRTPIKGELSVVRDLVEAQLNAYFDAKEAGWGAFQKYPLPAPMEHALLRWRRRGDEQARTQAVRTGRQMRNLIDPVWGGMYQYSVNHHWTEPHFEKIAAVQAGALESFSRLWLCTGDEAWLADAEAIRDYILKRLKVPGGFATSEDADAHEPDGSVVPGDVFYGLDAKGRAVALPKKDARVHGDLNGLLVKALVVHHDATQDKDSLRAAIDAMAALTKSHRAPNGAFRHGQEAPLLYLRDNAAIGRALIALADSTGDPAYAQHAQRVALFLLADLEAEDGGFYANTVDPEATGLFKDRRKPLEDNGVAVRFLLDVAARTEDEELAVVLHVAAEKAVRALATAENLRAEAQLIGNFLLAAEAAATEPAKVVVAGAKQDAAAQDLYAAALRLDVFGKTVRWATPGEYPPTAAYVCRGNACSPPAKDRHALRRELLGAEPTT